MKSLFVVIVVLGLVVGIIWFFPGVNQYTKVIWSTQSPYEFSIIPEASFTSSTINGREPVLVYFSDTSTHKPVSWYWSFTNVTENNTQILFSTSQNPEYFFSQGNYSIILNVSNSAGYNITPKIYWVNVSTPLSVVPMGILKNAPTYLSGISTYDGTGQETHPCVIYSTSGWNDFHYLMAMTPYQFSNESYENPSMRYSNDKSTWNKIPGQPDPIITNPGVGYNSDPYIFLKDNTLFLFYRYTNSTERFSYWNYTTTTDGVVWTRPVKMTIPLSRSNSFLFNGTGWEAWGHNTTTNNLTHFVTSNLITWVESGITLINQSTTQWHSEVKLYDAQYQLLVCDGESGGKNTINLRFYTSTDGLCWADTNNNSPVLSNRNSSYWDNKLYKSSFIEINNTYDVFYTGWTSGNLWHIGYTKYPQ